jgi:PAS domain S-box-containing protein
MAQATPGLAPTLAVLQLLDAAWFLADADGRAGQACARVTAWLGAGFGAGHWQDLVHPDDRALAEGQPVGERGADRRCRMADGSWRWFAHRSQAIGAQTLHVLQDIDARKRREIAHSDAAGLLDSLRLHLPGVFYKLDADEQGVPHVTFVSEAVRELLEYEPDEVEADFRRIFDRVHPDDRERFQAIVANALRTHADTTFEYRVVLPRKGVRHVAGRACSALQSTGRQARFGYQHDITEQKLYQEALVQARAAEQASELKSEFLSRMSHELRTPLNAILGFAQLLKMSTAEPLGAEQWARVDVLERAGRHLLALVNDVLDLSRIEAGHMALHMGAMGVRGVFDEVHSLVVSTAHAHRVSLRRPTWPDLPEGPLAVRADMLRLQQVLVNLMTNAIKYNRPGGDVWLAASLVGSEVCLTVRDNGQGMTPEQQAHLFEPFNRLGAEGSDIDGSGIGMVIVQRLVQLMGGRLSLRSAPGEGTEVSVFLPRAESQEVAAPLAPWPGLAAQVGGGEPAATPASSAPAQAAQRPVDILCVEDNEVNIALLTSIMELRPACALRVARSGAQALKYVAQRRPDLMLIDMQLGDMSGLDLASSLDRDACTAGIPRIALSADAMPGTIREAQARGFLAYVTKPVDVRPFLATLDQAIEQLA